MVKTETIGYSERGLVNALVKFLTANPDQTADFLKTFHFRGKGQDAGIANLSEELVRATFFIEPGLGEFGNPDILLLAYFRRPTQPYVFFIEAKTGTYRDSALMNSTGMQSRGFNSSINGQLSLKYRFFRALVAWDGESRVLEEPEGIFLDAVRQLHEPGKRPRRLAKAANIDAFVAPLRPIVADPDGGTPARASGSGLKYFVYYVALTADLTDPLETMELQRGPDGKRTPLYQTEEEKTSDHDVVEFAPRYLQDESERSKHVYPLDVWAWGHTGWCGWFDLEDRLEGLADYPEYRSIRTQAIGPTHARLLRNLGQTRCTCPTTVGVGSRAWNTWSPEARSLAASIDAHFRVSTSVRSDIGLDVRRMRGSLSVTSFGRVVGKLIPSDLGGKEVLLVGVSSSGQTTVPALFDLAIVVQGQPFLCATLDVDAAPDVIAMVLGDWDSYIADL